MNRLVLGLWCAVISVGAAASREAAAAPGDAATAFGAREAVRQASLSPDGKSIALVRPMASGQALGLFIASEGADGFKLILTSSGGGDRLRSCNWVSNTRLVCSVQLIVVKDAIRLHYSRVIAINADGSNLRVLSARPSGTEYGYMQDGGDVVDWLADDSSGAVLMSHAYGEQYSTGTLLSNKEDGLGVDRVDTQTLQRTVLEPARTNAALFISDQHGLVRIYGQVLKASDGYSRPQIKFYYRPGSGGSWQPLGVYDQEAETGFWPAAVDRDLNAAYGFEKIDGRLAVVRVALDGSLKREVIEARDDVDVDELIRVGRQRRVVGVGFATDRRQAVFFDPALNSLAAGLSKALPGQPAVRIVDASLDENRLLIWAGSDVAPGRYYLYDRPSHRLSSVIDERPQLAAFKLAHVQAVTYKAADGTLIPAYLTLPVTGEGKNLPAIVLPHGGPGSRDEWGFDWLAQYFANRGYAVLQPNFRGSTGYGDAWLQKNGFQSWKTAVGDVNDAGRWLKSQGIAAPGRLAIVGWSYGGYAALQSQVLDPDIFNAVVAIAPVTDFDSLREQSRNFVNFKLVDAYIGRGPHLREGSPAQNAERIKAPVLMFHGDEDDNVDVRQSQMMLSRLKAAGRSADLVVLPGLDHQLDDSAARAQMLDAIDGFLRLSLGL